jgi:hypothetical protein
LYVVTGPTSERVTSAHLTAGAYTDICLPKR